MARDLLYIPMAGVGIKRAFSYARDMCGYRRGQLKPETLRALMLVYYAFLNQSRVDELQEKLRDTFDIKGMTEEEMEAEIQQQEAEINIRNNKIDTWDIDFYISDEESTQDVPSRTRRIQLKHDYIERKGRRNRSTSYNQTLSSLNQGVRADLEGSRRRLMAQREQDQQNNPGVWEIEEDGNRNIDGEEVELPDIGQLQARPTGARVRHSIRSKRPRVAY